VCERLQSPQSLALCHSWHGHLLPSPPCSPRFIGSNTQSSPSKNHVLIIVPNSSVPHRSFSRSVEMGCICGNPLEQQLYDAEYDKRFF
jgi:hypothetical protein